MIRLRTPYQVYIVLLFVVTSMAYGQGQPTRNLAQGILTTIPPEPLTEETYLGPIALPITKEKWTPNYAPEEATLASKTAGVVLRHNIWNLEFTFKPLRMVYVDVPQPNGKMHRKLIWYMVYRVRNLGGHLTPVETPKKTFEPKIADQVLNIGQDQPSGSIRFFPHFVMESKELGVSYLDRVVPTAIPVIQQREMRGGKLYNSVEISKVSIPVTPDDGAGGVWGVATWEAVDPRIDYLSIYVGGLTNAFRIVNDPQKGVHHALKVLQLNFWRPGDAVHEHEGEIRYGVPSVKDEAEQAAILEKYNVKQRLDHLWVYR